MISQMMIIFIVFVNPFVVYITIKKTELYYLELFYFILELIISFLLTQFINISDMHILL